MFDLILSVWGWMFCGCILVIPLLAIIHVLTKQSDDWLFRMMGFWLIGWTILVIIGMMLGAWGIETGRIEPTHIRPGPV